MRLFISAIFILIVTNASATTWAAAFPYIQYIEGQAVTIEAIPYNPYAGSPLGVTKVYFKNKLLYTLDKYYREKIFTSSDGQYLAIVHITNSAGITSFTSMGHEKIDYNQPAIEVYKNGVWFKSFSLKEIIDTSRLLQNGFFFHWGYDVYTNQYMDAQYGCESCLEFYSKKILRNCDTAKISFEECEECNRQCDSVKIRDIEVNLMNNSIYVSNNCLYILSNQGIVIKLSFNSFSIEKLPFDKVIHNKYTFSPNKVIRKYKKVRLPNKFDLPDLKSGKTLKEEINNFFTLSNFDQKSTEISIYSLIINKAGICINAENTVYTVDPSNPKELIENTLITTALTKWIKEQRFNTSLIPKGYDQYSFYSFIRLK